MRITKSNQEKNEKKNFKEVLQRVKKQVQGITLIALVVTIIVLLILAGVALSLTVGDNGLFKRAQNAADTWQMAEQNEQIAMGELERWIDLLDLQIGDYVSYTPDKAESYQLPSTVSGYENDQTINQDIGITWQILSINNDGTIDITTSTPISEQVYFSEAIGYNNIVYVLNDLCATQYSNSSLGVTARSINLEDDIEPKMNETGIEARNSFAKGETYAYGNVKTYTNGDYIYYPNLYAYEQGSGIDTEEARQDGVANNEGYYNQATQETYTKATTLLTVTSDYYSMRTSDIKKYFDNATWYNLVFGTNTSYWLASRCVRAYSPVADFSVHYVNNNYLDNFILYNSDNYISKDNAFFRPVVSFKSDVKICGGDGSEKHPYQLEKYK